MTQAAPAPSATEPHAFPRPRATQGWASLRQAYDLALAGAVGAIFGLYLYVELVQAESVYVRDGLAGLIIGGSIGFFLTAWGPFRDGAWHKLARAVSWGVPAAALGGALGLVLGELVIGLFRGGLLGRACSWSVLGLGIGLGQGLADRSRQRLIFGLIGGGLGGFVGGYCFEAVACRSGQSLRPWPGSWDRDPGWRAGPLPCPGRAGPAPGLGPGAERTPGGPHLPAGSQAAAALAWTNAPRSASSAIPTSPVSTPRSRQLPRAISSATWPRSGLPGSTARPSREPSPCTMATGWSSARPSWSFDSDEVFDPVECVELATTHRIDSEQIR